MTSCKVFWVLNRTRSRYYGGDDLTRSCVKVRGIPIHNLSTFKLNVKFGLYRLASMPSNNLSLAMAVRCEDYFLLSAQPVLD